ncbi:PEP-CTERM sorting domain-containing protein [Bremerella cremea]|nr:MULTISPECIES: PEP-CTERM sorting domain-containing protein [Pirellulaceae]RCS45427.1 PEP-CTERM sorting domain-containing protein [Bremerella cremea]
MRSLRMAVLGLFILGSMANISQADIIASDQLTSNVFFGSGNSNANFTVSQDNGVEIGMRAKVRYPVPSNDDQSAMLGYDVDKGVYYFANTDNGSGRASWNLDWSVNSDFAGTTGNVLSDFAYNLTFLFDPQTGSTPSPSNINPVSNYYNDNSYGNNTTTSANDVQPGPLFMGFIPTPEYAVVLNNTYNVTQNSTNVGFSGVFPGLDVTAAGVYTIIFSVTDCSGLVASNQIQVYSGVEPPAAAPEPTSIAILGMGALGLAGGGLARRRLKKNRESANS